ncbi:AGZA family xanthine/uracil permease-like MFS transporter [Paenibacillus phyllosphaerae]|uniref:AGZA family xanthine/uracil permease-like MFS transporter n=1 Tax=Paenibacillus phyllosphaerae TaxID=274593 RepID=A0A7W5B180_9BACL|nr:NCS2 family permease [Paenibacillus phyllosphaerae]MBB3112579.1 AGZA family xanthine/uracil permease-like MFS transporter [Paenibacillus phyllosphaerae]
MNGFFRLKEHGTNARTEILAGLTTFMTMAYILALNPNILGSAGLSAYSVFLATALAAGIFTIVLGLFVNFPVALAPGMGLNAYFASTVLASQATDAPITPEMALTAVFMSGIIFLILTITQVRQMLIVAVPDSLKHAITVGIGLFITIIGLKNSGVMTIGVENTVTDIPKGVFTDVLGFETVIHMGNLEVPSVYLTLVGLALIAIMMVLRVPGAILWGILATTVVAIITGNVDVGQTLEGQRWIPDFSELNFWNFDFSGVWETGIVSVIVTFTFVELFDTFGTLIGTANRAGIMKDPVEGKKRVGKAMFVDAVAVSGGAMLGTSTVTAYVESSAGIAQGGRTGLTAVSTGVAFLAALFLWPLISLIPGSATAAALIIVGVLMVQSIKEIDFQDMVYAIPAFFIIAFMPFTYNIANGISFGLVSYVLLAFVGNLRDKGKYKIHWLMWILAVLIVLRYALVGSQG